MSITRSTSERQTCPSTFSTVQSTTTRGPRTNGGVCLNNRYHDPTLGAFISVDPLVTATGEPYIYGSANPMSFSDPSGLFSCYVPDNPLACVDLSAQVRQTGAVLDSRVPLEYATSLDVTIAWQRSSTEVDFRADGREPIFRNALGKGVSDHYSYEFVISDSGSAEEIATRFVRDCETLFPIDGCSSNFTKGQQLDLRREVGPFTQSFPVQVRKIGETEIQFEAVAGHPEGVGRRIAFDFVDADGSTRLIVTTWGPGSFLTQAPIFSEINNLVARSVWSQLADSLRVASGGGGSW